MPEITIRPMTFADAAVISRAFTEIGWDKSVAMFDRYVSEQVAGERVVFVAEVQASLPGGEGRGALVFAGYGTIVWTSVYPPFAQAHIPEIVDLNVLPNFRRRGIATRILDEAEAVILTRSKVAGIGVGLYADYGSAQRLYIRRGYIPDGRGVTYADATPDPGSLIRLDDNLVMHLTKQFG